LVRSEGDFPSGLVDEEEGETNYYYPRWQLNKQARDWSLLKFKRLRDFYWDVCPTP
jgi:hypothetical protein